MGEKIIISDKRKRIRISHIIILLFLIAIGAFTFFRINLKHKLNTKIESMRAAGYLLTMEELKQKYSIPPGSENAADLILRAIYDYHREPNNIDIQKLLSSTITDFPAHIKPYSSEIVTLMEQYLKANEKALEMLHKASGLKYCSYPENFYDIEGYLNITKSIKLLNLQAVYFSETGDSGSALKAIISSFNIVSLFAKEPRFTFHLTRVFYYGQMTLALKFCLNQANFTEEQMIKLEEAVTNALDFSDLHGFYEEEMCRIFDIFSKDENITEDIISQDVPVPVAQFCIFFYKHLGIVDSDRVFYLDYMSRYIEAAKLPLQERYNTFKIIETDLKKRSRLHIIDGMLTGISRNIDNEKKVITVLQTAKAAIAVKRYYLAKGTLPDTLKNLLPAYLDAIPVTPDGKELKYKIIDAGCIIYSEGGGNINNINKTPPQNNLINHGIPNLGTWFMIENNKGVSQ